ncbi:Uma2 family endonuclease [Microseira sp. BLCC-F43]|uniref:Uma2 family endonuclease n=1 Tax=Microseira sp. BLCC-F43 TaxID=3153602 RepID=UPI0035B90B3B
MLSTQYHAYFSPEEYLEIEENNPIKHEYRQGLIYAMAGASKAHVIITLNISILLNTHLEESDCLVYSTDMKVRVEGVNDFYYPDVAVTCDERDRNSDEKFIRYACLIVEVLSPKTEDFDREGKFNDYKTLETLSEYVLISQDQMRVECFRRDASGNWIAQTYEQGEEISFQSINFSCPIASLYRKVSLLT